MKATTHTEVYRRFEGELRRHPLRPLTIAASGMRTGFKRKLPVLLLFMPVGILCIVNCVRVHLSFLDLADLAGGEVTPGAAMGQNILRSVLGDVVDNIFDYLNNTAFLVLLVVGWFGAGLIAEDRRLGANLLYFSRPITRFDYMLGKFLGAGTFGALALTAPCMLVCGVAAFSSKDWIFLREEWPTIFKSLALSLIWVATITALVLAVSSLVNRKTHALVGIVGVVALSGGISELLAHLLDEPRMRLFSIFENFKIIGNWMFGRQIRGQVTAEAATWALLALWVGCLAILAVRVRKMEVAA